MRKLAALRAVTLIEIVIVVALIAILSLGATRAYGNFTDSARRNSAVSAGKLMSDAINIKAHQDGVAAGHVLLDSTGADPTKVGPLVGDYTLYYTPFAGGGDWVISKPAPVNFQDYYCDLVVYTADQIAGVPVCKLNGT